MRFNAREETLRQVFFKAQAAGLGRDDALKVAVDRVET